MNEMHFEKLVYASAKMAALCELARVAARSNLPVLIHGETGTGKELLARGVHRHSSRNGSPLLVQNCGGMPDDLLQSELFGHKRGAFTGAISDRLGLFRAADGGTVFLDEISEVSPSFQVSLLRVLQEGEVKPLGSDKISHCDVRIIAASNKPLKPLVAKGAFRQDLYFRLKGFELDVPPLRERRDDIAALAAFFIEKYGQGVGRKPPRLSPGVLEFLRHYDFPGNVRELESEIRHMVALAGDGATLSLNHLSPNLRARDGEAGGVREAAGTLKSKVERLERELVRDTLIRCHWNQSRASDQLGLSRVGLANKIKRYGLDGAHIARAGDE
jgi:two-component system response regulator HupR/HoxA